MYTLLLEGALAGLGRCRQSTTTCTQFPVYTRRTAINLCSHWDFNWSHIKARDYKWFPAFGRYYMYINQSNIRIYRQAGLRLIFSICLAGNVNHYLLWSIFQATSIPLTSTKPNY
ncbi:hypothetical protein P167DRAFT_544973 [Morchella conica CCBAS932]|uniref:Uncharacterized protein n=1 Tax=Morchella conica CCBAS932 TaxID=1392247 RepID=A0A3N4KQU0_9PEZI|nr:hypothetical protein P167DRAFT_544973 [Morchella conica CCBAS932]